jgi:hypothetical protein
MRRSRRKAEIAKKVEALEAEIAKKVEAVKASFFDSFCAVLNGDEE